MIFEKPVFVAWMIIFLILAVMKALFGFETTVLLTLAFIIIENLFRKH